jgi:predicted MPP superfamily phosphohydrolase
MKRKAMLIFFLIIFTVYFLINYYIFIKGYKSIPPGNHYRTYYTVIFLLAALTFIGGKILERINSSVLADVMNITGGFWMAFMLYGFLFLFLSDIVHLILRISGLINRDDLPLWRKWSFIVTLAGSFLLITAGFINALFPVVRHYKINISKQAGDLKTFRIAAVSDIHLGSIIRKRSMKQLSRLLDAQHPDVVFLLGDIVDGEPGPVLRDNLLSYLKCPECSEGMLAITGNHEYIGGSKVTIPYIRNNGIRLLTDEVVTLKGGIKVIGRIDRDGARFNKEVRLPLDSLMKGIDPSSPVLLLDHQPLHLNEAVQHNIDLQLSGHTHNGQMWPLNYITSMIYEISYGYKKIGNTQFIVSSGFGLWGARVRLGSRSEILVIDLAFSAD